MFENRKTLISLIVIVILLPILLYVIYIIVNTQTKQNIPKNPKPNINVNASPNTTASNSNINASFQVKAFKGENGWGYDIYENGKLSIHQPNIPALPGNNGYTTEAEAQKNGELTVEKIKENAKSSTSSPAGILKLPEIPK